MQKPIFPLPEPVPDLILPGSVEYVRKHNPFRSAGASPGIPAYDSADPPGSRSGSRSGSRGMSRGKSRGKSRGLSRGLSSSGMGGLDLDAIDSASESDGEHGTALELKDKFATDPDLVRESYSNKPLRLTKSIWSPVEGRLNIDTTSILRLGTGQGDIRNLGKIVSTKQQQALDSRMRISADMKVYRRPFDGIHDVVRDGPVVGKAHRFWSAKLDDVDYDDIPVDEFDDHWDTLKAEIDAHDHDSLDSVSRRSPGGGGGGDSVTGSFSGEPVAAVLEGSALARDSLDALVSSTARSPAPDASAAAAAAAVGGGLVSGGGSVDGGASHHSDGSAGGIPPSPLLARQPCQDGSVHSKYSDGSGGSRPVPHSRGHGASSAGRGGKKSKAQIKKDKDAAAKAEKLSSAHPTQVPAAVKTNNAINWAAFEAAEMEKLTETVLAMEANKWKTGEAPLNKHGGGVFGATEEVRQLARIRVRMVRGIVTAIEDEEEREHGRKKAEDAVRKTKNKVKLKQLKDKHEGERHMHRTYIRTMRHDNEISWNHRLQENGYLW